MAEAHYGSLRVMERRIREEVVRRERQMLFALTAIYECDVSVGRRYSVLAHELDGRGLRIPQKDLWIAATAIDRGCVLVSSDRHFDRIIGLTRVDWSVRAE